MNSNNAPRLTRINANGSSSRKPDIEEAEWEDVGEAITPPRRPTWWDEAPIWAKLLLVIVLPMLLISTCSGDAPPEAGADVMPEQVQVDDIQLPVQAAEVPKQPDNAASLEDKSAAYIEPAAEQNSGSQDYSAYYTAGHQQCLDNSTWGDFNYRDCNNAEMEIQDGRLNQAYKMVMQALPADRKAELRQSERLWIKQRDATCEAQAAVEEGGTLWHVIHSSCLLDETIKRRLFLERFR